jgi:hypothetical protein
VSVVREPEVSAFLSYAAQQCLGDAKDPVEYKVRGQGGDIGGRSLQVQLHHVSIDLIPAR